MLKSLGAKLVAVGGAAALVAGLTAILVATAPSAKAAPQTQDGVQSHTKGDRLAMRPTGAACSSHGWPHYEQSCQFDLSRSADAARTVRVLDLGRDVQLANKKTIGMR
jgi:hypothetical protein